MYFLNWLVKCNDLTQKMYAFRNKMALLKVKIYLNLNEKIN